MVSAKDPGGSALERLREFGLRYPGAHTKSPWPGHLDLAVNDKTFAYLSIAGEPLRVSCKLPRSSDAALELPFTTPTAYGLGKSGWVTAEFPDGAAVPVDLLEEWIDESYRAQAPKRLSAGLVPFPGGLAPDDPGAAPPKRSARGKRERGAADRSTVKRAGAAVAARSSAPSSAKRDAATPKATRGALAGASKPAAPRSASKPTAARGTKRPAVPRAAAKRAPAAAVARSGRATKRAGGSPRAAKKPAKKRARAA